MSYYAANPYYAPDDFSEQRAKQACADHEAGTWFAYATKPQTARYNARMEVAAAYRGVPRWAREREAALKEFAETTVAASELCAETVRELMKAGEVSEALQYRWEELAVAGAMAQAAE
ncbi:hypothetical protein [Bradyrhizobium retamae]|uniref:Uncharacterized protein n=1 Tax=Bradyrhizobium retamae TaxID=1300035 RepID=A0A0R3MNZ7_9BRAD|nr:hypothetical protein [Bradyrhizobium retamae]KRR21881.1 hypothetical protein CQ13_07550 [Bradyrhizobium retamae]